MLGGKVGESSAGTEGVPFLLFSSVDLSESGSCSVERRSVFFGDGTASSSGTLRLDGVEDL